MDRCKICGNLSLVLNAKFEKVPFRKNRDARSFTCGLCVARGALRSRVKEPEELDFDLKEWRRTKSVTQLQLAEVLGVDRSMVAKVEIGEKVMPRHWEPVISKM